MGTSKKEYVVKEEKATIDPEVIREIREKMEKLPPQPDFKIESGGGKSQRG